MIALFEIILEFLMLVIFIYFARREAKLNKNSAPVDARVVAVEGEQVSLSFRHSNGEEVQKTYNCAQLRKRLQDPLEDSIGQVITAVYDTKNPDVLIPMPYEKYQKAYKCQKIPVFVIIILALFFSFIHNVVNYISA